MSDVEAAMKRLVDAQRDLTAAHVNVARAQQDLSDARAQGHRELGDPES